MGESDADYTAPLTAPARLLAVEILLAEPELLGNDALETDLYILREDLRAALASRSRTGRPHRSSGREHTVAPVTSRSSCPVTWPPCAGPPRSARTGTSPAAPSAASSTPSSKTCHDTRPSRFPGRPSANDPTLLDQLPYATRALADAPDRIKAALLTAFQIQGLYNNDTNQTTIWATLTEDTPRTITALLEDRRTDDDTAAHPAPADVSQLERIPIRE